jgi:hypothetical protein
VRDTGIEQARKTLGEIANRAEFAREITFLTRNGRRIAAVVPLDRISDLAPEAVDANRDDGDVA